MCSMCEWGRVWYGCYWRLTYLFLEQNELYMLSLNREYFWNYTELKILVFILLDKNARTFFLLKCSQQFLSAYYVLKRRIVSAYMDNSSNSQKSLWYLCYYYLPTWRWGNRLREAKSLALAAYMELGFWLGIWLQSSRGWDFSWAKLPHTHPF